MARHSRIPVRFCQDADRDHRRSARAYAHVAHRPGVICIGHAFVIELPDNFVYAILLHELGHLALLNRAHSEQAADRAGSAIGGVCIVRRSWGERQNLEYVASAKVPEARRAVYRLTTFRALRGLPAWRV